MDLDLLVIGSGPGGQRAAIQAAKLGKRVGVVERHDRIGGVSIHSGTIPSKTLRQSILDELAARGADLPDPLHAERHASAAERLLHDRVARVVAGETAVVREQFRRNGVGLIIGHYLGQRCLPDAAGTEQGDTSFPHHTFHWPALPAASIARIRQ